MQGMKEFPDKYFDLAIVDPAYGRKEHGGRNRSGYVKQKNGSKIFVKDGQYENRNWDNKPPSEEYFKELIRVSKNQIPVDMRAKQTLSTIMKQPTAYDIDKVVEQLNKLKKYNLNLADIMLDIQANGINRHFICLEDTIEIVKAGGSN